RDTELLQRVAEHNALALNITVTTTDVELARLLEPRAPRPDIRLEAVRRLKDAGLTVGVIAAPVLPGITDSRRSLDAVGRGAEEAGADYIFTNPLFMKPCSAKVLIPFLQQHFPQLVKSYEERYARNGYVTPAYRKQLGGLVNALCKKYGMPDRDERARIREL